MDLLLHKNFLDVSAKHFYIYDLKKYIRLGNRDYLEIEKWMSSLAKFHNINLINLNLIDIPALFDSEKISTIVMNTGVWPLVLNVGTNKSIDESISLVGSNYGADFFYLKSNLFDQIFNFRYAYELNKWRSIKKYNLDFFIFPNFMYNSANNSKINYGFFKKKKLYYVDQIKIRNDIKKFMEGVEIDLVDTVRQLDLVISINSNFSQSQFLSKMEEIKNKFSHGKLRYTLKFHPNYKADRIHESKIHNFMKSIDSEFIDLSNFQKIKSMPLEFLFTINSNINYLGNRSSALSYLAFEQIYFIDVLPQRIGLLDKRSNKVFDRFREKYNSRKS